MAEVDHHVGEFPSRQYLCTRNDTASVQLSQYRNILHVLPDAKDSCRLVLLESNPRKVLGGFDTLESLICDGEREQHRYGTKMFVVGILPDVLYWPCRLSASALDSHHHRTYVLSSRLR